MIKRLVSAELILIIASVFIFRSLWHLLDKLSFMNETWVLGLSLIIAIFIAIPALRETIKRCK